MGRYFTLLDADLSKFKLGKWWGYGRYEEELPVEGIYLYAPQGNEFILGAVRKKQPDIFCDSEYDLYEIQTGDGRYCRPVDFTNGTAYKQNALKRTNVHITFKQLNDLDVFAKIVGVSKAELIREAIDEKIEKLKLKKYKLPA